MAVCKKPTLAPYLANVRCQDLMPLLANFLLDQFHHLLGVGGRKYKFSKRAFFQ
ncbi:hypothetical protein IBX65_05810 [Candidatus Aerophobetes bacterium]|nr:hypothetical protein [Candidatus Aerophobetes bacterium]